MAAVPRDGSRGKPRQCTGCNGSGHQGGMLEGKAMVGALCPLCHGAGVRQRRPARGMYRFGGAVPDEPPPFMREAMRRSRGAEVPEKAN